jgi:hypothetical protein
VDSAKSCVFNINFQEWLDTSHFPKSQAGNRSRAGYERWSRDYRFQIGHRLLITRPRRLRAVVTRPPLAYARGSDECGERIAYFPWPPAEPWPPDAAPAEDDPVDPEFAAAAGAAETLEALLDIAPEYPAEVCDIPL